jgi:hypothetical protein
MSGGIGPFISLHLQLDSNGHLTARPSWWSRAVNLRDGAFQFFADAYARKRMFQPALENYWLEVDHWIFMIETYGARRFRASTAVDRRYRH